MNRQALSRPIDATMRRYRCRRTPWTVLATALLVAAACAQSCGADAPAAALVTLDNGLRAVLRPEPGSSLVGISVVVRAGIGEEQLVPGVGSVVAHALFGPNVSQPARVVARMLYQFGGVQTFWGPDYTQITCVTVPESFDIAMDQIAQAIMSADLDGPALAAARQAVTDEVARRAADPFDVAYAAVRQGVHAEDVYRLPFGGEPGDAGRVTAAAAQWYRAQWFAPKDTVVSVVGGLPADEMRSVIERKFVLYARDRPQRRHRDSVYSTATAFDPPVLRRRVPGRTVMVALGYQAPAMRDPDYPAFAVLCSLAGNGKSSRLFRAVRDVAGIGYRIGVYAPPRLRQGEMMAYVELAADRTGLKPEDVARKMADTLQSIIDRPPDAAELERAKRFTIGSHLLARQRVRDRASALSVAELIGPGYASDEDMARRVAAVTTADVERVAERYLARHVTVIVGP